MKASEAREMAINSYNSWVFDKIREKARMGRFSTSIDLEDVSTIDDIERTLKDLGYEVRHYFEDEGECYIVIYW